MMYMKQITTGIVVLSMMSGPVLACESDGGKSGTEYADMVIGGESGGDWHATNNESTATGAFQFTYETLRDLGYIHPDSPPVSSSMFGTGSWENVIWTKLDGVDSRESFMNNQAAQVNALSRFTQKNLNIINPDYTTSANGVPLTQGGVAYAAHFLGAGGFDEWRSCGYQPSCLPQAALDANSAYATPQAMNDMLMGRMAEGGNVDPSCIDASQYEGDLPPIYLMPWWVHKL